MKQIELPPRGLETLFGVHDQNIKLLESLLDVTVNARGHNITVNGEADDVATRAVEAAQGLTDLERATRDLEQVATMLRDLTRGFASVA